MDTYVHEGVSAARGKCGVYALHAFDLNIYNFSLVTVTLEGSVFDEQTMKMIFKVFFVTQNLLISWLHLIYLFFLAACIAAVKVGVTLTVMTYHFFFQELGGGQATAHSAVFGSFSHVADTDILDHDWPAENPQLSLAFVT